MTISIRSFELEKRLKATPSSSQNSEQRPSMEAQDCEGLGAQGPGSWRKAVGGEGGEPCCIGRLRPGMELSRPEWHAQGLDFGNQGGAM